MATRIPEKKDMTAGPKRIGPDVKKKPAVLPANPGRPEPMHARKPWAPKGRAKVKSKLSAEPVIADPPGPKMAKGPGYDDAQGYTKPSANPKGYTRR